MILEFAAVFLFILGLIIGLGAVTVIDLHGFLARNSNYWTLATTRTHKVTKPMIWIGIVMIFVAGIILYSGNYLITHIILSILLVLNGIFLSFVISPYLLKREREGMESEILPQSIQTKIIISFIFSIIGWWTTVVIFALNLIN